MHDVKIYNVQLYIYFVNIYVYKESEIKREIVFWCGQRARSVKIDFISSGMTLVLFDGGLILILI